MVPFSILPSLTFLLPWQLLGSAWLLLTLGWLGLDAQPEHVLDQVIIACLPCLFSPDTRVCVVPGVLRVELFHLNAALSTLSLACEIRE